MQQHLDLSNGGNNTLTLTAGWTGDTTVNLGDATKTLVVTLMMLLMQLV